MAKFTPRIATGDFASCPYCRQAIASPSFEQTVAILDLRGSERSILEAVGPGNEEYLVEAPGGRPVHTETIHRLMYRDHPDLGPNPGVAYKEFNRALASLNGAGRQLGISVQATHRKGYYRLHVAARSFRPDAVFLCNCPCCGQGVERPTPEMAIDNIPIPPKQAEILLMLCRAKGLPVLNGQINDAIGSKQAAWHICQLRKLLLGSWISIQHVGYAQGHRAVMAWESAP